jgi:hypothetical protein
MIIVSAGAISISAAERRACAEASPSEQSSYKS